MPLTQHLQGTEGKLSESPEFEDNLFYKVSSQYSKGHTEKPCFTLPPISIHVRAHTRAYTHTHTHVYVYTIHNSKGLETHLFWDIPTVQPRTGSAPNGL